MAADKKIKTGKPKFTNTLLYIVVILLAIIFAVPLYIAVVNIFKPTSVISQSPMSLPLPPIIDNIKSVLSDPNVNIWKMYLNSIAISLFGSTFCIIFSAMAAYYVAHRTQSGSKAGRALYIYFLFGLMVPYVIVYVPLVTMLSKLHIPSSLPVIIMVFISGSISFSVFMFYAFINSLPKDLEEAAIIDGAGQFTIFWKIVFPLVKPCTTTVAIFIGLSMWNDFLTPLLIGQIKTITVGIYTAIGPYASDWGSVFAYVMFATLPIAIAYICAQKQFIAGLTAGALKG